MAFKVVVITGASSGIGKAIALELAKNPSAYRLVLAARSQAGLDEVVAAVGGTEIAIAIPTDVTKREQVKALVAAAVAKWGRVDVMVNNAGAARFAEPSALTDADVDEMMAVNVKSALYGMQEALPFVAQTDGILVNVGAILARVPVFSPGLHVASSYTAAKAYLNSLTDTFRAELKIKHPKVTVSHYIPGPVDTPFGTNAGSPHPNSEIPNVQSVEETASIFVEEIVIKRREDVYSRAVYGDMATQYLVEAHSK